METREEKIQEIINQLLLLDNEDSDLYGIAICNLSEYLNGLSDV